MHSNASRIIQIKSQGPDAIFSNERESKFREGSQGIWSVEIRATTTDKTRAPEIISKVEMARGLAR